MLEAVRIAVAGFPTRKDIVPFAVRWGGRGGEGGVGNVLVFL